MKIHKLILIAYVLCTPSLMFSAISVVYNIRIAETTKLLHVDLHSDYPSAFIATPFGTFRKKLNHIYHSAQGVLGTLSYTKPSYYLRVDGAFGHVHQKEPLFCFSHNQPDDILFSGGYSFYANEKTKITMSGFLGFPTHNDKSLLNLQLGYGHIGSGAQVDTSYLISEKVKLHGIRAAARCIHFFPKNTSYLDSNMIECLNFSPGNLIDLFASYFLRWGSNRLEIGYDLNTIVNATTMPYVSTIVNRVNFVRSNFFGTYKHHFTVNEYPNAVAIALSYGFDHKPTLTGLKRILTVWGSWSINF